MLARMDTQTDTPEAILARLEAAIADATARRGELAMRAQQRALALAAVEAPLPEAREHLRQLETERSAKEQALLGARVNVAAVAETGTATEDAARAHLAELQTRVAELPSAIEEARALLTQLETEAEGLRADVAREATTDSATDTELAELIEGYHQRAATERGKLAQMRLQLLRGELATRITEAAELRAQAEAAEVGVKLFRVSLAQRMGALASEPTVVDELAAIMREAPSPLEEALAAEIEAITCWRDRAGNLGTLMLGGVPLYRALSPAGADIAVAAALRGENGEWFAQRRQLLEVMLANARLARTATR